MKLSETNEIIRSDLIISLVPAAILAVLNQEKKNAGQSLTAREIKNKVDRLLDEEIALSIFYRLLDKLSDEKGDELVKKGSRITEKRPIYDYKVTNVGKSELKKLGSALKTLTGEIFDGD